MIQSNFQNGVQNPFSFFFQLIDSFSKKKELSVFQISTNNQPTLNEQKQIALFKEYPNHDFSHQWTIPAIVEAEGLFDSQAQLLSDLLNQIEAATRKGLPFSKLRVTFFSTFKNDISEKLLLKYKSNEMKDSALDYLISYRLVAIVNGLREKLLVCYKYLKEYWKLPNTNYLIVPWLLFSGEPNKGFIEKLTQKILFETAKTPGISRVRTTSFHLYLFQYLF